MGWICNVLLSFSNEELWVDGEDENRDTCEPLERINAWIDHGRLVSLVGPTFGDDVGYGMDANLYGGGFKHFDMRAFIEVVKAQDWKERAKVQLWIKEGQEGVDDDPFTVVSLGRLKAVPPEPVPRPKPKGQSRSTRTRRRA